MRGEKARGARCIRGRVSLFTSGKALSRRRPAAPPHASARVDSHEVVTPRVRPPHFAAARTSVDTRSRRPASVVSEWKIWLVSRDFSHRRYARHNVPVREPPARSAPRLPTPCPPHAALRDRVGTSSSARPRVFASRRVCPGVDLRASLNSPPLTLPSVRRVRPLVPASLQALTPTRETRRRSWVILPKAPRRRPSPTGPPRLPRSSPPRVRPPRVRQIRPSGQTLVAPFVPRGFGILSRSRLPPPTRPTDPSPPSLPSPLVAQWARKKIRIERIADERNRQVTFTKRKNGLIGDGALRPVRLPDCARHLQLQQQALPVLLRRHQPGSDSLQERHRRPARSARTRTSSRSTSRTRRATPTSRIPSTTTTTTDSTKTAKRARAPTRALARVAPPRAAVSPPRRLPRLPRLSHSPEMEIPNARIRRRRRNLRRDGTRARIPWTRTSSTRRRAWRRSRPRPRVHLRSIPWAETLGGFWNTFRRRRTRWARPGLRRERRRGARGVPYPRRARPRRGRGRG